MKLIRWPMPTFLALAVVGLLPLGAAGCGGAATSAPAATDAPAAATTTDAGAAAKATRAEALASLTALVILPGYAAAADSAARLNQATAALCDAPGAAALAAARLDWRGARRDWLRTESYRFGPAMDRRSASLVDWHPVDTAAIDGLLDAGETVTAERVREYLPATQRGLGAAEYLLFGPGSEALAEGGSPGGSGRCAYAGAVTAVVQAETAGIWADWRGSGADPGYAGFYDGTAASSLLDREAEAVAVRSLVFQVRAIANMRLAVALGLDGAADVAAIPAGAADNSRADLVSQLDGIAAIYGGGAPDGLGLSARVRALSADTDARMRAAIQGAAAAARGLEGSIIARLATAPAEVRAVYDRIKEMQRILNTEIVSLLGVSVGFADTDGDS